MVETATVSRRRFVALADLKEAPYNPPNRTAEERLRELKDSVELVGLLHPITITPGQQIIDGHRRVAVAKILGWEKIECNVTDLPPEEVYGSVNATPRRMSGNDSLTVYLLSPTAVHPRTFRRMKDAESALGRPVLKKIQEAGCSLRVYDTARRICRYCDEPDNDTARAVVEWLLAAPAIGQVMKAMEAGVSPRDLMQAVRRNKPIRLKIDLDN